MSPASRQNAFDMLPLFGGLLVACVAAVSVIGATVDAPFYELAVCLTIAAGLVCSFLTARGSANLNFLGTILIVGAFTAFIVARRVDVFPASLLYPFQVIAQPDIALAALIAWVMVGFCFIQSRREHTILCLVSGLAVLGLMGTVNLNAVTIVSFLVYLFAAIYTLAYDNLLRTERIREVGRRQTTWLRWSGNQLIPTAVLFLAVAVIAAGASHIMYQVSPDLYENAKRIPWRWPQVNTADYAEPDRGFWVGGGRAHLTQQIVMTVESDTPALWRGRVYDTYEGQSWFAKDQATIELRAADGGRYQMPELRSLIDADFEQVFHLEKISSAVVFAAAQPAEVGPITDARGTQWMAELTSQPSGVVQVAPAMPVGSSYRVVSKVPDPSPQQLRAAGTQYLRPEWTRRTWYWWVPVAVETRLGGLVEEVTASAETPYDKVTQIMEFLEQNYLYTESPPRTPRNMDSAIYFLLTSKRGDCGLFATAMAMMCRLAGVPTRVATGFATGQYDFARGTYLVRGKDAHAWVEVYFPGYGWVPFDPQAQTRLEEETLARLWRSGQFRLVVARATRAGTLALGILALIALLGAMFVNVNLLGAWWQARLARRLAWNRLESEWHRFYRKALRKHGLRPGPEHTPNELLDSVLSAKLVPVHLGGTLRRVTAALYELRYSAAPATDSQIDRLRRRWLRLRKRI